MEVGDDVPAVVPDEAGAACPAGTSKTLRVQKSIRWTRVVMKATEREASLEERDRRGFSSASPGRRAARRARRRGRPSPAGDRARVTAPAAARTPEDDADSETGEEATAAGRSAGGYVLSGMMPRDGE